MKLKKNDGKVKGSISNVDNPAKQEKNRVTRNPQEKGRNHDDDDSESKDEKRDEQGFIALKCFHKTEMGSCSYGRDLALGVLIE